MMRHLLRASIALALLATPALAQRVYIPTASAGGGGGATGACSNGQFVNNIPASGTPGCADVPGNIAATAPYVSGRWINGLFMGAKATTGTSTVGTTYCQQAYLPVPLSIQKLGIRVLASATGNVMTGAFAINPLTGNPTGTPLVGNVFSTGTANFISVPATATIPAGWHYECFQLDNASATLRGTGYADSVQSALFGGSTQSNLDAAGTVYTAHGRLSTSISFSSSGFGDVSSATWTDNLSVIIMPYLQFQVQ